MILSFEMSSKWFLVSKVKKSTFEKFQLFLLWPIFWNGGGIHEPKRRTDTGTGTSGLGNTKKVARQNENSKRNDKTKTKNLASFSFQNCTFFQILLQIWLYRFHFAFGMLTILSKLYSTASDGEFGLLPFEVINMHFDLGTGKGMPNHYMTYCFIVTSIIWSRCVRVYHIFVWQPRRHRKLLQTCSSGIEMQWCEFASWAFGCLYQGRHEGAGSSHWSGKRILRQNHQRVWAPGFNTMASQYHWSKHLAEHSRAHVVFLEDQICRHLSGSTCCDAIRSTVHSTEFCELKHLYDEVCWEGKETTWGSG